MASVCRKLYNEYSKIFDNLADHRSDEWFLMGSPWPVIFIAISYVYFVQSLGPRLMKHRAAFNVEPVVRVYNLMQIFMCLYLVYSAHALGWGKEYDVFCEPIDYSNTEIAIQGARTVWLYFILKVVDLLDTVFFVLRKKSNQISFLHVYHHVMMMILTWATTKFLPGGHGTFLGYTNSIVHAVMYSYYFVTSMWPEYKGNFWWKKYVTQLQMIQFVLIGLHASTALVIENCEYPASMALTIIIQSIIMFKMFYDFYQRAYVKKTK